MARGLKRAQSPRLEAIELERASVRLGSTTLRAAAEPSSRPAAEPLLQLAHASVYRDGRRVLGPLDWTLAHGEHCHVAGPNGAGRSTLVALLYGDLAAAAGGRIERRGCPRGTPIAAWKRTVGLVSPELQSTYAATACTVEEIVLSGLHSSIGLDEVPAAAERADARRWLARLGLRGLGQRRTRELSYGQLRRALVARALVTERQLLLLDEPFDGLDAPARELVAAHVAAAVRRGTQVVLATHHPDDVPAYVTWRLMLPVRKEMAANSMFFFRDVTAYDEKAPARNLSAETAPILAAVRDALAALPAWRAPDIHTAIMAVAAEKGVGLGKVAQPVRVAVSGGTVSPPIDVTLEILGRETTLQRLDRALAHCRQLSAKR